jgi:hypothetical protein
MCPFLSFSIASRFVRSFSLICLGVPFSLFAEIALSARTNGFGLVVLEAPVSRAALAAEQDKLPPNRPTPESPPGSALWINLPDGTRAAVDWDVTRFLPENLIKVYTMSSTSPVLAPGTLAGSLSVGVRADSPFAAEDWALQPYEVVEKQTRAQAFFTRYQPDATSERERARRFYEAPALTTREGASKLDKLRVAETLPRPPELRVTAGEALAAAALSVPVTVLEAGKRPAGVSLGATADDLAALPCAGQVPLGNYNYDMETVEVLGRPNELTVAEGRGVDLFAVAERSLGRKIAAVELVCYNGFTSNLTAAGQGLLLVPPDGDIAAALTTGSALFVAHDPVTIIALRRDGASPAESASGVIGINVLMP